MMGKTDKAPLYKTTIDLADIEQVRVDGDWIDVPPVQEWVHVRTKEGGRPMLALSWKELNADGFGYDRMIVLGKTITAYRLRRRGDADLIKE